MRFTGQFSLFCVVALSVAMVATPAEAQRGGRGGEGGGQRGGQRGGGEGGGQRGGGEGGGQRGGGQRGGQGGQRGGTQFGGRGGTTSIGRSTLLRSEDVQKELNVSDAQMDTIKEAMDAFRKDNEGSRPDFAALREMSTEERNAMIQKLRDAAAKTTKESDAVLEALLEPAQVKRLDEIAFQLKIKAGMASLLQSEDFRKELSLTDEQVANVTAIQEKSTEAASALRSEMQSLFTRRSDDDGGERPDPRAMMDEMRKKSEDSRKETETELMAVLTDSQKSKIEEMKGQPFELDTRSLLGGRGGRGGADGGGRGGRGGAEGGGRGGRGGAEGGGRGGRGGAEGGGRGGRGGAEGGGRGGRGGAEGGGRGGRPAEDDPSII
ncbi:MAG: Spy/CpxP family protein refolding chaperone [Fuerstiella sp.]